MHFDRDYREVVTLRDGSTAVLRLIRPEDKETLRRGFDRMSPESRYLRFFTPKAALTDDELRYLTEIDQVRHFALGAARELPDGSEEGLGVARFVQLDGKPGAAEAAIAVVDDMHGKGLGTILFVRLIAAARERGVSRFHIEVLGSNRTMQEFVHALAPASTVKVEQGVVTLDLPLPAIEAAHPPAEPPRDNPIYALFKLAARGAFDWQLAVARMLGGLGRGRHGPGSDHEPDA